MARNATLLFCFQLLKKRMPVKSRTVNEMKTIIVGFN